MHPTGRFEYCGALALHCGGLAELRGRRRHESETRMAVLVVVPREELCEVSAGVRQALETLGKLGAKVQVLNRTLRWLLGKTRTAVRPAAMLLELPTHPSLTSPSCNPASGFKACGATPKF